MAYLGVQPTAGQYRKLDNISASFNGSTTSFTTSVGGTAVTAGTAQQLLVSLGGVIQQPNTDYSVTTSTITFSTAPTAGLDFFAVLMGDALNTGTPSDGSVTSAKLGGNLTVDLAAGSAAAPSLTFDTTTGLYAPGTDQVAIATAGTGRLFVTASGLVGIGTSAPPSILSLEGTDPLITFRNSATNRWQLGYENTNSHRFVLYDTNAAAYRLIVNSSGNVGIGSTNFGGKLTVKTSSSNGAPITWGDGQLVVTAGDGTTAPGFGISTNTSDNSISLSALTPGTGWNTIHYRAASHIFYRSDAASNEVGRFDTSGRFLVGTSSDTGTAKLCVKGPASGTGAGTLILQTSQTTSYGNGSVLGSLQFGEGGNLGATINMVSENNWASGSYPSRLVFSTTADGTSSPTEHMRITQGGAFKFSSNGTYGGSTTLVNEFYQTNNATALNARATNASFTDSVFTLDADRNTTNTTYYFTRFSCTGVAYRFQVADSGNVTNTNNSYAGISDLKLKENISDANSQWGDIKSLQVRNYNFKEETGQPTHRQIGLIAQEVEEVSPGLVLEETDRDAEGNDLGTVTKSVNYSVLYMKAVKALQEAMERIETLEAKVAALEAV
mgnify:CR=1 FL=1